MKNKITVLGASAILFVMPIMASAQTIDNLIEKVTGWVGDLLPIMLTLGVLAFFWGLAKFLFKGGAADKQEGQTIMIWGILAVFIMASIGGIVGLLQTTTGTQSEGKILKAPCIGEGECNND